MSRTQIDYQVDDGVATITFNRPDKMNALTRVMERELRDTFDEAGADAGVRAIVLTGRGRAFCAGMDMDELEVLPPDDIRAQEWMRPFDMNRRADYQSRYSYFPAVPKPVISAINGAAAGLGFVFAAYSDFRFASSSAVFATAFAKRGLIAEHGGGGRRAADRFGVREPGRRRRAAPGGRGGPARRLHGQAGHPPAAPGRHPRGVHAHGGADRLGAPCARSLCSRARRGCLATGRQDDRSAAHPARKSPAGRAAACMTAGAGADANDSHDAVLYREQDGVACITLNRPARRNAIDLPLRAALLAAIERAGASAAARAVLLTGAGGHFCAGGDLSTLQGDEPLTPDQAAARMAPVVACAQALLEMPKPVIAAVDGVAYGGGLGLALCADAVVATPGARLCASFLRLGLVPDFLASFTLPRLVGLQRARSLVYGAQELSGREAHAFGLVGELAEADELQACAMARAQAMGALSSVAFALAKRALLQSLSSDVAHMAQGELRSQAAALATPEHRAALREHRLARQPR